MNLYFITGIGTDVGKTIVSAILCEAMQADYWKPIQAGTEPQTDSQSVGNLLTNTRSIIHPESIVLKNPMSPHAAASLEGLSINPNQFNIPKTNNSMIIEGAGGLMVPINNDYLIVDLIKQLNVKTIVVSRNYLGSINHTLLTCEILKQRKIPVAGIIFNGDTNEKSESVILHQTKLPLLGKIQTESKWNKTTVLKYSKLFSNL